jgi:hypothetical protein
MSATNLDEGEGAIRHPLSGTSRSPTTGRVIPPIRSDGSRKSNHMTDAETTLTGTIDGKSHRVSFSHDPVKIKREHQLRQLELAAEPASAGSRRLSQIGRVVGRLSVALVGIRFAPCHAPRQPEARMLQGHRLGGSGTATRKGTMPILV